MSFYHLNRDLLTGIILSIAFSFIGCKDAMVSTPVDANNKALSKNAGKSAVQRPITDFTSTQTVIYGWYDQNNPKYFFVIDYAGILNNRWNLGLPTSFDGKIIEKPLADGTAEVHVMLIARDALTYVIDFDSYFNHGYPNDNPNKWVTYFGEDIFHIVSNNATPTVGEVHWNFKFINTAPGAAIPDMADIIPTRISEYFNASAFGPLKEIAGLGPDGTPGHAWTTQVAMLKEPLPGGDGWPVEFVKLQSVGRIK
jgi:hypothetical protein